MRVFYLLVTVGAFFSSCYTPRYMYSPPAQNVPVLVNKGDSKLGVYLSSNLSGKTYYNNSESENKNRGYDLQGAYAFTNDFAVQANYFNRRESNNGFHDLSGLDSSFINYKRNLTEIAIGFFTPIDNNKQVMFQIFGGIGGGQFSFTDNGKLQGGAGIDYYRSHQATITKLFFQPAFMFRSKGIFAISLSSRFSFIKFGNIKTNYTPEELIDYKLSGLNKATNYFWEPAFTNTFGFKKLPGVQLEYQFGSSILVSGPYIKHRALNFSLALLLDIPKLLHPKPAGSKN